MAKTKSKKLPREAAFAIGLVAYMEHPLIALLLFYHYSRRKMIRYRFPVPIPSIEFSMSAYDDVSFERKFRSYDYIDTDCIQFNYHYSLYVHIKFGSILIIVGFPRKKLLS